MAPGPGVDVDALWALLSGVALLATGLALLVPRPRRGPTLVFAAFCAAWGVQIVVFNLPRLVPRLQDGAAVYRIGVAVALLQYLFLAYFPTVYPRRVDRGAVVAVPWAFGAAALCGAGAFILAPELLLGASATGAPRWGVLYYALVATPFYLALAFAAVWLLTSAHRLSGLPSRQARTLGAGLLMYLSYVSVYNLRFHLQPRPETAWIVGFSLVGLAAVAWVVAGHGLGRGWRGDPVVLLCGVGPASVAAAETAWALAGGGSLDTLGFWRLGTVALVAYAVARKQLFDLDLRIKWTVEKSTVAAVFLAVFFASAQLARVLTGGSGTLVGLAAAGLVAVYLGPVQRAARGLADAVLPGVEPSTDYVAMRKLEVYQAALDSALAEGDLTERERSVLARLRSELGISDHDHAVMEHVLRASRRGAAGAGRGLEAGSLFLQRYRVRRMLGEGGAGATYLCRDERVGRDIVLKRLRADGPASEALRAVLKEARAVAAVDHPNVVRLLDVVEAGDEGFLIMEYLPGGSLRDRLRRGPLSRAEFGRTARDLLAALEAVHRAGLLHRDVKPGNLLLATDGTAKLADFGVASIHDFDATTSGTRRPLGPGTIAYMSPEQAKGRALTARSDLFSAGATLFEALAGEPYLKPRRGESALDLRQRAAAPGPFRRRLDAPPRLKAWFARALAPEPEQRYPSARGMREGLDEALNPERSRAATGRRR